MTNLARSLPSPIAPVLPNPWGIRAMDLAQVRVHGRRVSWSLTPDWDPRSPAFGPTYLHARDAGLAGSVREHARDAVRRLLRTGARVVIVFGSTDRIVVVRRTGNDLRTAWSETDAWSPSRPAEGREYEAARALGLAGVSYGARPMDSILDRV